MTDDQQSTAPAADTAPSQADLYEDLRRIGELEDEKAKIQSEIETLTDRLTKAIPRLEKSSLLHQMLSATMKPKAVAPKRTAKATKRTTRKK
ncbi:hypothetical protein ACFL2H_09790 [Planctomycetota bacterium]